MSALDEDIHRMEGLVTSLEQLQKDLRVTEPPFETRAQLSMPLGVMLLTLTKLLQEQVDKSQNRVLRNEPKPEAPKG